MAKVLIVYYSRAGSTEKMAEFIGEGVRMAGHQATLRKTSDIKNAAELAGYDGYIFGSPTYYLTVAEPMKTFLFMAEKGKDDLKGKLAGAFCSYTHDGNAPGMVFDTMQYVYDMQPFELGPFKLKEHELAIFDTRQETAEAREQLDAMRACQQYGRVFAEKLGK